MKAMNRRVFVQKSLMTAAAITTLGNQKVLGANEKIVVGVMGLGGRGTFLAEQFAKRPDVEVAYLCDADSRRFARARETVQAAQGSQPKVVQDFRRILEDRNVDVLVNATPDHWHALGAILACQAGKDVYIEKPMAHNIWEGRKMIEAARKYQRMVQVGTQTRSAPYMKKAVDYIQAGKLGEVYLVRVFNMMQHPFLKPASDQPVPSGLDYDMWCGPAAKLPYSSSQRWLNLYEYSCGPIPGDAVHQLDCARFLLGDPPAPKTVSATGAIYALRDGRDTPDTQLASYEYDKFTLSFEATLWTPYMKKIPVHIRDSDLFPNWPFTGTRIEVFGTKNFMWFGRHGGGWQVYNESWEIIESTPGRQGDKPHIDNFLQCVRTRSRPNADVEQGHNSVLLCHLANIACRVGNQKLAFDAQTESFPNSPDANQFLKRAVYRQPWAVPDSV
jgi:predicted dehydrogenase